VGDSRNLVSLRLIYPHRVTEKVKGGCGLVTWNKEAEGTRETESRLVAVIRIHRCVSGSRRQKKQDVPLSLQEGRRAWRKLLGAKK
jgi:hypothetical protein